MIRLSLLVLRSLRQHSNPLSSSRERDDTFACKSSGLPNEGFPDSLYKEVTILSCPQAPGISSGKARAMPLPKV